MCFLQLQQLISELESQVERDLEDHPLPPLYHEQEHFPLGQVAPSPVQPGLECFQGWGCHNFSGEPVPGPHHPLKVALLSYIQSNPALWQCEAIPLVRLPV